MKITLLLLLICKLSFAVCFKTVVSGNSDTFALKSALNSLVSATSIENASLFIGNKEKVLFKSHYGHSNNDLKYDIASLTKIFTATTLMKVLTIFPLRLYLPMSLKSFASQMVNVQNVIVKKLMQRI